MYSYIKYYSPVFFILIIGFILGSYISSCSSHPKNPPTKQELKRQLDSVKKSSEPNIEQEPRPTRNKTYLTEKSIPKQDSVLYFELMLDKKLSTRKFEFAAGVLTTLYLPIDTSRIKIAEDGTTLLYQLSEEEREYRNQIDYAYAN